MLGTLRFAPPWTVEETEAGLVVKDPCRAGAMRVEVNHASTNPSLRVKSLHYHGCKVERMFANLNG